MKTEWERRRAVEGYKVRVIGDILFMSLHAL